MAFIPLYGALVRPLLEHGMPVSLPNLVADINQLERIRHLSTKSGCSGWAFIPCSGDNFGLTGLLTSGYSWTFFILIRT